MTSAMRFLLVLAALTSVSELHLAPALAELGDTHYIMVRPGRRAARNRLSAAHRRPTACGNYPTYHPA